MRFSLIDRIIDLREGESITAIKSLTLAEEYLRDHFPRFPVMPGVLMLEAMYQAGSWLIQKTDDFAYSVVVLREARNVKYADFIEPGQLLTVTATIFKEHEQTTTLKAEGRVDEQAAVSARLILERYNLAERYPPRGPTDEFTRRQRRRRFELLYRPLSPAESVL